MHTTLVKMKDGRTLSGILWMWRPREGWFEIVPDEGDAATIMFRDVERAVTRGERVGVIRDDKGKIVGPKIADVDELERARQDGWDGR